MTITITQSDDPGATGPRRFVPTTTEREAIRLGYTKAEYREAVQIARLTAEHHRQARTARSEWRPPPHIGNAVTARFVEDAAADLEDRLDAEVDPVLDDAQDALEDTKAALDEIAADTEPLVAPESGIAYSTDEATAQVQQHTEKTESDAREGKPHHHRASPWLKRIAPWVPFVEFIGFLWFCAVWLNVPILEPWLDFGAWTLSVALVSSTILGQTWLVHHGARNHNHGREAFAENNRQEGERAYRRRNWYLGSAALTVTAAITGGMALRGVMTLGGAGAATFAFMVFLAAVAGYVMPALVYLAIATDGSAISRERDELRDGLDGHLAWQQNLIDGCKRDLASVEECREVLLGKTFPSIVDSTQAVVDAAYRPYGLVRLLIGHLRGEEPKKIEPVFTLDDDGRATVRIATSIPGADAVNLKPLFDRAARLACLDDRRRVLAAQVAALPAHPWSTHRTR